MVLLMLLAVQGCAGLGRRAAGPRPEVSHSELLAILERRAEAIGSLRGLVTLRVKGSRQGSLKGILVFQRPQNLRLQGLDLLGRPIMEFATDGDHFRIRMGKNAEPIEGRLADLSPVSDDRFDSLPPSEIFEMVLSAAGGPRVAPGSLTAYESTPDHAVLYLLRVENQHGFLDRKIWVDRATRLPSREERFGPDGKVRLTVAFEDYQKVDPDAPPVATRVVGRTDRTEVDIEFEELQIQREPGHEELFPGKTAS